jgi:hypothetical protein
MSTDIDLKACTILERLSEELADATVDYCCTQDMHEFQITRKGLKHEVGFLERVLELRDLPDIEQVVKRLVEELKTSTQSRRIRVGSAIPA